jgi:hypothetical protein
MAAPTSYPRLIAVVHYPRLNCPELDELRRDHDPFASSIAEHITLLFPVAAAPHDVIRHTRAIAETVLPSTSTPWDSARHGTTGCAYPWEKVVRPSSAFTTGYIPDP